MIDWLATGGFEVSDSVTVTGNIDDGSGILFQGVGLKLQVDSFRTSLILRATWSLKLEAMIWHYVNMFPPKICAVHSLYSTD